jgi:hypothetical protein
VAPFAHSAFRLDLDPRVAHSMRLRADRRAYCGVATNHNDANAIHVLATRFPVVRRMVGEQSFRLMAQRFIMSKPPRFPIALTYGESFPSFLRTQGRLASIEYVADIAELEVARRKAQQAADARPIDVSVSRAWQAEHPNGVRVILHPSLHVVASRFPIVTIWENNQRGNENCMIERWRAEAALVARPFREVEICRLPPCGHTFIGALARGQTVAVAARAAMDARPDFDAAAGLAILFEANAGIGVHQA